MGNTAKINLEKLREVLMEESWPQPTLDELMEEIIAKCVESPEQAVNHPAHYQGRRECIEVMRSLFGKEAVIDFCKCNSFKYRFRASEKNGAEDIEKAEWYEEYLEKLITGAELRIY